MSVSAEVAPAGMGWRATIGRYYTLTKPGIIMLLLVTTVPAMIVADGGMPSFWLIAATIIGGSLAAGGAGAINSYVDRERDQLMQRTQARPIPMGDVEPRNALIFGLVLGVIAFVWLAAFVNLLTAALAVGALGFYVVVYTMWLKPNTPQNIVIGGAAGAVPPLCGWAAVTGEVGWAAAVLFAIVFLWTPPHFWALALRFKDDYARAQIPMLPVVSGEHETKRQILGYTVVLLLVSLLFVPAADTSWLYPAAAVALGGVFIALAVRLYREDGHETAMGLFRYSILYLTLLFASVGADEFL